MILKFKRTLEIYKNQKIWPFFLKLFFLLSGKFTFHATVIWPQLGCQMMSKLKSENSFTSQNQQNINVTKIDEKVCKSLTQKTINLSNKKSFQTPLIVLINTISWKPHPFPQSPPIIYENCFAVSALIVSIYYFYQSGFLLNFVEFLTQ